MCSKISEVKPKGKKGLKMVLLSLDIMSIKIMIVTMIMMMMRRKENMFNESFNKNLSTLLLNKKEEVGRKLLL